MSCGRARYDFQNRACDPMSHRGVVYAGLMVLEHVASSASTGLRRRPPQIRGPRAQRRIQRTTCETSPVPSWGSSLHRNADFPDSGHENEAYPRRLCSWQIFESRPGIPVYSRFQEGSTHGTRQATSGRLDPGRGRGHHRGRCFASAPAANRMALLRRQQGVHPILCPRSNQSRQRQESAHRLAAPGGERQDDRRVPRYAAERVPARDSDHDRRRALYTGRTRPGDCAGRRNRPNDLGAALRSGSRRCRGASTRGVDYWRGGAGNADRRIFAIRGEYLYALDATTGVPVQTFGNQGRVLLRFADRQPLAGRFNDSTGPLVLGNVVVVTGNTGGAGDGGNTEGSGARGRPRLRRRNRQAPVDVPRGAAARRVRQRHVGQRFVENRRRPRRVEPDDGRRGARLRLRPADVSHGRVVRRLAAGRQPVLEFAGRTRRQDGQARVALPDRPSRFVGLGQHRAADAWRDHRGRQAHPRGDAGEQGGLSLRARPDQRPSGVADRRAARAAVDRAGRTFVAHAAISDEAAGLRSARHQR